MVHGRTAIGKVSVREQHVTEVIPPQAHNLSTLMKRLLPILLLVFSVLTKH